MALESVGFYDTRPIPQPHTASNKNDRQGNPEKGFLLAVKGALQGCFIQNARAVQVLLACLYHIKVHEANSTRIRYGSEKQRGLITGEPAAT